MEHFTNVFQPFFFCNGNSYTQGSEHLDHSKFKEVSRTIIVCHAENITWILCKISLHYSLMIKLPLNKSDSKRWNTLGFLDQYTCNVLRLWNSQDHETVWVYKYAQRIETMKQSGLCSSLGTHGSLVVIWRLCVSCSGETRKFDFLSQIWLWRSRSIAIQNNKDLNQAILHIWSKFGNPSLNG